MTSSSETTTLSDQAPRSQPPTSSPTLIRLNEHHSVLIVNGGDSLADLHDDTNALASSNSGELNTHGVSTINLSVITPSATPYGIHVKGSHGRSQHLDLDVLVIDVGDGGLLHSRLSQTHPLRITSRRSRGFRTSGKWRNSQC